MWQGFPWALFTLTNELPNYCAAVEQLLFRVFLQALMELKSKKSQAVLVPELLHTSPCRPLTAVLIIFKMIT